MIISANKTKSKEIIIHNDNELSLLIKYGDAIHWSTCINQNKAVIYALSHLFKDGSVDENILHWIKMDFGKNRYTIKADMSIDSTFYEESIKSSSLNIFDKLLLLKIINPQFKDKEMLSIAINEYDKMESSTKKSECRAILSRII